VTVSDQTICAGQSATLTASGATTYQWSNGATGSSITVSPTTTTNYSVTGTTTGCTSIPVSAQVTVTSLPNDSIFVSGNTISALQGGATYQWIDCNGNLYIPNATNQTFQPTITGNYALIISNNLCADTSNCISFVITGVKDLGNDLVVSVFPNPTEGDFIIHFSSIVKEGRILVYNELGQLALDNKISNANSITINLEHFPPGMYLVKIQLKQKEHTFKVIKK
jgi:hypothetical protein